MELQKVIETTLIEQKEKVDQILEWLAKKIKF